MAHLYFLHNRLQTAPAGTPIDADQPVVEVLNSLEIGEACFLSSGPRPESWCIRAIAGESPAPLRGES